MVSPPRGGLLQTPVSAARAPRAEDRAAAATSAAAARTLARRSPAARLETRTKESNVPASVRARQKPRRAAKANAGGNPSEGRTAGRSRGAPRDPSSSAAVRTRKTVNYACAGRSQGKPWWRPAAVLTCKSIVGRGHGGERPIEPSGSWFPPKFPSG